MTAPKLPEGLEPVAWKCGNEFAPYHPSASHVNPDHRDGWNACYRDAQAALQALAAEKDAEIAALKEDAARYEYIRSNVRGKLDGRGRQEFDLPDPHPLGNIMRGSVAQHLDAAIDSALLAAKEAK